MTEAMRWIAIEPLSEYEPVYTKHDDCILLFDIDKTLYRSTSALEQEELRTWKEVYKQLCGCREMPSFEKILASDKLYGGGFFKIFNITYLQAEKMRGIFPYEKYLSENKRLRHLLSNIRYKKWGFTNSVKWRAERILDILNITDTLDGVICSPDDGRGDVGKPWQNAYTFVENVLGIQSTNKRVLFFDDQEYNIDMGRKMGWMCYMVGKDDDIVDVIERALLDIKEE